MTLALACLLGLGACKSDGASRGGAGGAGGGAGGAGPGPGMDASGGEPVTRAAVVKALAACTFELYRSFLPAAQELSTATAALAAAAPADLPASTAAARAAWHKAIDQWQEIEVFQYGPLDGDAATGGKSIRDNVYSWPFSGRCAVEQELVSQRYQDPSFPTVTLINARGLAAAEYLLFHEGTDNGCPAAAPINGGAWAALAAMPEELSRRKRQYAAAVAEDVRARASELVGAWEPARGNFLGTVESAGAGSAVFASAQAALNAQSDALFYVENPGKDFKLGKPLGLKECGAPLCPDDVESRFALRSKSHLARNLDGFEKLFSGCGGPEPLGFDDLLRGVGAGSLATRMGERVAGVRAALAAAPGDDLRALLTSNPAVVRAIYDAQKALVDLLRTEFITVLNLQLPKDIQTDND